MSPILVRPVREQLEHDRIIRQLQAKFRRKFDAQINPGVEQNAAVAGGQQPLYPDVVLNSLERGRKLLGVVEVETGESVNHLEALAQWAHFGKTRVPFYLYVPAGMVDVARRLAEDNQIYVSEIWSFHTVGDQVRFTMVHRSKEPPPQPVKKPASPKPDVAKPAPARPTPPKPTPSKPAPVKNGTVARKSGAKKKPARKPTVKKKKR